MAYVAPLSAAFSNHSRVMRDVCHCVPPSPALILAHRLGEPHGLRKQGDAGAANSLGGHPPRTSQKLTNRKPITGHHAIRVDRAPTEALPVREVTSRMPATVDATTDAKREPDNETPADVTLNYEAMLAALNGLLAEMREERRQAEASGSFADAQHGQEPATVQPNAWVEAHAMLSKK
jgi:hypothetical protein